MRLVLVEYGSPRKQIILARASRAGPRCATNPSGQNRRCCRPRVPQLGGMANQACRISAGWRHEILPNARTTSCRVEPLGIDVLFEDPQEHAHGRTAFGDEPRRLLEQGGSDPMPLEAGRHMQIVDEGTPERISVEHRVDETHELSARFRHDGVSIAPRLRHAADPDLRTIGDDVAIEVDIGVRTSVVTTPALSVEQCHRGGVGRSANAVQHVQCARHVTPHRSWRWHRAARPGVGPSKGQVPRVTLDEQPRSYGSRTARDGTERRRRRPGSARRNPRGGEVELSAIWAKGSVRRGAFSQANS